MQRKALLSVLIIAATSLLIALPMQQALAQTANTLIITSLKGNSISITYEQLQAMPKTVVNADLFCDGAFVTTGNWDGVQLSYLLSLSNSTSETGPAQSIQFTASDGYSAYIPINVALDPNTIIAYAKDGTPLNEGLRLVLPGYNGASWIAMITTITVSTSGAQSPLGISAGPGSIAGSTLSQNNTPQGQQQTPTSTPTQQPTTSPVPTSQTTSPANGTLQNQPASTEQTNLNAATSQSLTFLAVALGALIFGTAIVLAFYLHKKHAA